MRTYFYSLKQFQQDPCECSHNAEMWKRAHLKIEFSQKTPNRFRWNLKPRLMEPNLTATQNFSKISARARRGNVRATKIEFSQQLINRFWWNLELQLRGPISTATIIFSKIWRHMHKERTCIHIRIHFLSNQWMDVDESYGDLPHKATNMHVHIYEWVKEQQDYMSNRETYTFVSYWGTSPSPPKIKLKN
jgi:hypothetical protein